MPLERVDVEWIFIFSFSSASSSSNNNKKSITISTNDSVICAYKKTAREVKFPYALEITGEKGTGLQSESSKTKY